MHVTASGRIGGSIEAAKSSVWGVFELPSHHAIILNLNT